MVSIDNYDNIINYIDTYKSAIGAQKQKGEVFTPSVVSLTMLDELDKTYMCEHNISIFSDSNFKWFDNSSGIGHIMVCVYHKLFDGLKQVIPDEIQRKQHILENMLYFSELDKKNTELCRKIFDNNKLNIYTGDSLDTDTEKVFGVKLFDIIIGNPPYQKENKKNNSARGGTNNNLYIDFIINSISRLKTNGYLVYIHPQNWRKLGSPIISTILEKQLLHVSLNYGGSFFKNVSVKTDFYVLKNIKKDPKTKTNIKNYDKKSNLLTESLVNLNNISCIPNIYTCEIKDIMTKINKYGINYNCTNNSDCHKVREHVEKGKSDIYKYPLYNTSGNPFEYFSSRPHKDQYLKKVLLSCSGNLKPLYDDGKYGTTQDSMYILVNSDKIGKYLVDVLNTKLYKLLLSIYKWGNFRNEPKLLSYLKYPNLEDFNKEIDDKYIYKYFKLNKKEIDIIEKYYNITF